MSWPASFAVPGAITLPRSLIEARLRDFVRGKQKSALKVASSFVPDTWLGIIFRNAVTQFLPGRFVAKLGLGSLADDIELPRYEDDDRTS